MCPLMDEWNALKWWWNVCRNENNPEERLTENRHTNLLRFLGWVVKTSFGERAPLPSPSHHPSMPSPLWVNISHPTEAYWRGLISWPYFPTKPSHPLPLYQHTNTTSDCSSSLPPVLFIDPAPGHSHRIITSHASNARPRNPRSHFAGNGCTGNFIFVLTILNIPPRVEAALLLMSWFIARCCHL